MTAREYVEACNLFQQFGKIKDIDFDTELYYEVVDPVLNLQIRNISFEGSYVVLGKLESFGCDCCGSYWDDETYDLEDLTMNGYLDKVINLMNEVLNKKGIGC